MTLIIDIKPEAQAKLSRQAKAQGVALDAYAARLLEEIAAGLAAERGDQFARLQRTLDDMARFSDKIPALPDESLSRESLYPDHD